MRNEMTTSYDNDNSQLFGLGVTWLLLKLRIFFQDSAWLDTKKSMEDRIAELELEKGNLLLQLVDIDEQQGKFHLLTSLPLFNATYYRASLVAGIGKRWPKLVAGDWW